MSKRHKWTVNEHGHKVCADCGMTRHHETARKRAGYYGRRVYDVTVYRNRKGAQVWTPSLGNKVPPCRPPLDPSTLPERCTGCGVMYGHAADCVTLPLRRMKLHELRELYREASAGEECPPELTRDQLVAAIIEEPQR